MPDLLVRDVDDAAKRALAVQAALHSRSLQAEAKAILEDAAKKPTANWLATLRLGLTGVEDAGFVLPERHEARDFSFGD